MSLSLQSLCPYGDNPLVGAKLTKHVAHPQIPIMFCAVTMILFGLMCEFQLTSMLARCLFIIYAWGADWETGDVLLSQTGEGGAESGCQHAIPGFATDSPCNPGPSTELSRPACPSQMENRTLGSLNYFCPVSVSSMCLNVGTLPIHSREKTTW